MTVETYCACGKKIDRTYGNRSGRPWDGQDSLKVRVSIVTRLLDEHPSRVHLCRSCRREFVQRQQQVDGYDGKRNGSTRLCDFCESEISGSIRKNVKGPLGAVKSWSGKKQSRNGDPYERLDVCVNCQRSFIEFVKEKRSSN